jgi:hypothetical protein
MPQEMQQRISRTSGLATVPFETARSNLTVNIWPSPDGHPMGDEGINIIWLAFCSGTYLNREGRLIPLPCEILHHTPDRYAYTDKTQVFQDAPRLPSTVDLFMSRELYLSSIEDFYKGWGVRYLEWMRRAVTNIQEGTLTFHYEVTVTTNFHSWTFPLRFEFYQKGRDFLQNEDWVKRGVGTLKSIREVEAPKGLFDPTMNQTIADRRFQDREAGVDAILYTWTHDFTPQMDDPMLQEKLRVKIEEARRFRERESTK